MKRSVGFLCLTAFVATVWLANYAIGHWGSAPTFPAGPHTVTIGPWTAPSGVLIVGLSFSLRDFCQWSLGRYWTLAGIGAGIVLSALVADPTIAAASAAGFGIGELADYFAYTPLAERGRWTLGVVLSNTVGSLADSFVFLWLAFGWASLHVFLIDQWALKTLMIVPVVGAMGLWKLRRRTVPA